MGHPPHLIYQRPPPQREYPKDGAPASPPSLRRFVASSLPTAMVESCILSYNWWTAINVRGYYRGTVEQ